MKTKEQIELAQETIEILQDYIELAKIHKKIKRIENQEAIQEQLDAITDAIQVSKMYFRMVDENYKPLIFSEAFYLATKGGGKFFGKVGSFEDGYEFDAVVLDDSILPHPQPLNLAERMERAVYLGLDQKNITAKFVAGTKII